MGAGRIGLKKPLEGSASTILAENTAVKYLDRKIRFSLKVCDTGDHCITKLNRREIEALYKKLGYFEQITWRDVQVMRREIGFSIEKKGDTNDAWLNTRFSGFSTFLHFRVSGPFRVFGAMYEDLCYLLIFDPKGRINH